MLAIGHEMRHSSLWGRVKKLVDSGAIRAAALRAGESLAAALSRGGRRLALYDIARVGNWILEEPIHFFDLARWYFQPGAEPVAVFAQANARRADRPELTDHFAATVTFSGGQYAVIAQCLGGWEHHQVVKLSGADGAIWAAWSGAMDRTLSPTFSLKVQRGDVVEEIAIDRKAGEVFDLADQFAPLRPRGRDRHSARGHRRRRPLVGADVPGGCRIGQDGHASTVVKRCAAPGELLIASR